MKPKSHILIVDDEESLRRVLSLEIEDMGYRVSSAASGPEALPFLERQTIDLCLVDLRMPGMDGLELLGRIKDLQPLAEVLMLTGHGSIDSAIEAMRQGAYDFVTKPCPLDQLEQLIGKALEKKRLRETALGFKRSTLATGPIYLGASPAMHDCMEILRKAAPTDVSLLITGESGTGKELFAREAHRLSPFSEGAFVAINCGALQTSLVESTLFGHERGAFTGADRRKKGLVEVAEGGTLFLDEVGELPPDIQVKLLRFTQFGDFQRVGSIETLTVQTRLIAATNVDLEAAMARGAFRSDLFYRLNTVSIHIPPLRERPEDIPVLAQRFLTDLAERGRPKRELGEDALAEFRRYTWPGNVRELKSALDRLSILTDHARIDTADVRRYLPSFARAAPPVEGIMPVREMERRLILRALEHFDGNKAEAAKALQVSLKTLYNKLKAYEAQD